MTPQATAIVGPARTGKTTDLLSRYRRTLATGPGARCLWIAPTWRTVSDIRDRLLARELPACFRPGVATFDQVAEEVLRRSPAEMRPIGSAVRRMIVRRLVHSAHAERRLEHFGRVADTDGLIDIVESFIAELKRVEVWPKDFEDAIGANASHKDRELHQLYAAYQAVLEERQLYDQQGRFWAARTQLRQGQGPPFEELDLLVVDGFTDFTRPQHEILESLAARSKETFFTLPLDPRGKRIDGDASPPRRDLFDKTDRTLRELRERHPNLTVEVTRRPADTAKSALCHLESQLFQTRSETLNLESGETTDTASITILSVSRQIGEMEEIARRIKRLIVDEHVPPSDIGIVFRSMTAAAPLVGEVFQEMGIPVASDVPLTLVDSPPVRTVLSFLELANDDWPFRRLLETLNSRTLRMGGDLQQDLAAAAAERLVRYLQLPAGRLALLRQIERWAEEHTASTDSLNAETCDNADERDWVVQRGQLAHDAMPVLSWLSDLTESLPARCTYRQWASAVATLGEAFGVLRLPDVESNGKRDQQIFQGGWECLRDLLGKGDEVASWLDQSDAKLSLGQFLAQLRDVVRTEALRIGPHDEGAVSLLTPLGARTLRIPYLFLAGLSEHAFPASEEAIRPFTDHETERLIEADLPLVNRRQRVRDEMLLFYETVTRADVHLTLSYPAHDQRAEPLSPSPYVGEVDGLFGPRRIVREKIHRMTPVPSVDQPSSPAELRICAMANALSGDRRLLAAIAQDSALTDMWVRLSAGLRAVGSRRRGKEFGQYEGVLPGTAARAILADRFGSAMHWSPSRLEAYAYCPYRFFLEHVLNLEPLEDLSLAIDYRRRGQLLHSALADLHRRLSHQPDFDGMECQSDQADMAAAVSQVLDELAATARGGRDYQAALRDIDLRQIERWLLNYPERHVNYDRLSEDFDAPFHPTHFEFRFGPSRHGHDPNEDPLSTNEPLRLEVVGDRLLITGRIDRIDVGTLSGQRLFNVIDYKTGKTRKLTADQVASGLALQLPLYAMAVEALLLKDQNALPWQMGYWRMEGPEFAKQSMAAQCRRESNVVASPEWEQLRPQILSRVHQLVSGIRAAQFPVVSPDDKCTSSCDFRTVCRVGQARSVGKEWHADSKGPS